MAEGRECLMKWQLLNSTFELQFETITFTKTPGCQQLVKGLAMRLVIPRGSLL